MRRDRMAKFKKGEIVQLKSGGPKMTVDETPEEQFNKQYKCQWFAGNKLEFGFFSEEALVLPADQEKKG
jgi:uncharacterized protein YodC (DUF2158 family)